MSNIPKGYKQTEVGVIPEDWEVKTCEEICLKIQDGTHFSPSLGGNDYLYVTSKNIGYGIFDKSSAERIDAIQHKAIFNRCDVRSGDILLTKDGANTGNAALNHLDEEFSLLSSVAFLRVDSRRHEPGYYLQQILSSDGQKRIKEGMVGNAITRLTLEKIRKLRFPLPPTKAEQTTIAAALSDADALISSLEKLIAKKRNIKQGAMQELLTGKKRLPGFNEEWEVKKGYKQTEVGVIPEDWEVKKLGDYVKITSGESPSKFRFKSNGVPYFKVEQLNNSSKYQKETPYYIATDNTVPKGSVIFPKRGASILLNKIRILEEDSFMDTNLMTLSLSEELSNEYLFYILTHYELWRIADTTSIPQINNKHVTPFNIPLPPTKAEQTAIAQILSDMDAEIEKLAQKLAKYRMIKQGMMQELLTGKTRLV